MNKKVFAYFLIIAAAFCWGTGGVFTKMIMPYGYTSFEMVFLKTLVGLIILSAVAFINNPKMYKLEKWSDLLNIAGMSIFGYSLYAVAFVFTVNEIGVGVAGAMLYTKCVFVMILSKIFFGSKITLKKILIIVMTVVGCLCISEVFTSGGESFTIKGMAWGFSSGVGFAIYDVLGKKSLDKYSSETVNFYNFLIATVFIAVLANPVSAVTRMIETETYLLIIMSGVMMAALPYLMYVKGLSKVDVNVASVISTFELFTACVAGVALYNEPLTFERIMGIILIIGAVYMLNLSAEKEN